MFLRKCISKLDLLLLGYKTVQNSEKLAFDSFDEFVFNKVLYLHLFKRDIDIKEYR